MRRWSRVGTIASSRAKRAAPRSLVARSAPAPAAAWSYEVEDPQLGQRDDARQSAPIDQPPAWGVNRYCASLRPSVAVTKASRVRSRSSTTTALLRKRRREPAREPVVWRDRMPLHPKVQALLTAQRLSGAPPMHTLSPERARADMRAQVPAVSGPLASVARVEDRMVPSAAGALAMPVRIYTPARPRPLSRHRLLPRRRLRHRRSRDPRSAVPPDRGSRPARSCARSTTASRPSIRFPAAADDALAAARWFIAHADEFGVDRRAAVRDGRQRRRHAGDGHRAGAARPAEPAAARPGPGLSDHRPRRRRLGLLRRVRRGLRADPRRHALVHAPLHRRSGRRHRSARLPGPDADPARPAAGLRRDRRVRRAARRRASATSSGCARTAST